MLCFYCSEPIERGNTKLVTGVEAVAHSVCVRKRIAEDCPDWLERLGFNRRRLTAEDAADIRDRRARGESFSVIAADYGVGRATAFDAATGRRAYRGSAA